MKKLLFGEEFRHRDVRPRCLFGTKVDERDSKEAGRSELLTDLEIYKIYRMLPCE